MVARTNFLWLGELVGQLLMILINLASIFFLLPYFWGNTGFLAFDYGVYFFFGFFTLINLVVISWRWQRTQQRVATIRTHPEQWLAHWHYDQWTWQEYAQRERRHAYWSIAKWSIPFLLIVAFVSYMWMQTFGRAILVPVLAVMGTNLLALLVQVGVVPYYRILNTAPEAIITAEGVCIGGAVYFWRQGNAILRSLTLVIGQPDILEFKLQIRNGRSSSSRVVRVPIPTGYETQANQIIEQLQPIS